MTPPDLVQHRLSNHKLTTRPFKTAVEAVKWHGAVQAQEYALAKWGLSQRMPGAVDADIERTFNNGEIIRTHIMRPTWHFLAPEDVRWIMELTRPRLHAFNDYYYEREGLDKATFAKAHKALTKALKSGNFLIRTELVQVLKKAGIEAAGLRLAYILIQAEMEMVLCSGPRRGNQFSYALFDERVPATKPLKREEALAELTRRYFTSHGPAQPKDFAWWSGLTVADAKLGLELAKADLASEVIDGQTNWFNPSLLLVKDPPGTIHLLQPYDEYTVAYKERGALAYPQAVIERASDIFFSMVILDGQIVATWRRTFPKKGTVLVEYRPLITFNKKQAKALADAADRFGTFLGMKVELKQVG
jgi:Winged helix DNA-binding domain